MTPQEINLAIAELCGWKLHSELSDTWCAPHQSDHPLVCDLVLLPNFHSDLNACATFETGMTDLEWNQYLRELVPLVRKPGQFEIQIQQYMKATAPQRCEAFLRTRNKWIETETPAE